MYLTAIQAPQEDEIDALRMGLTDYNVSQAGCYLRERIASVIKDEQGKIHGGIIADIRWGWLHVDWLWVDEPIRQRGWGRRLLGAMEQYAQSKGITRYHLETTTFQALPFYQALGYQVFGQLPDMPPGHLCYFLNKQL